MANWLAHARFIIGALALMFVVAVAAPARRSSRLAGQSDREFGEGGPAPPADEDHQRPRHASRTPSPTISSSPPAATGAQFHEVTLPWIGAIAILGMLALLVLFYLIRGMVKIESGRSGRTDRALQHVRAFRALDDGDLLYRAGASPASTSPSAGDCCCRCLGRTAFAAWSQWGKYAHNYLSFPFTLGVVLILLIWIAGNIPNSVDVEWLKRGGGIVGNDHPPAYRFNAGQKMIYWIVVIGGGAGGGRPAIC